MVSISCDIYGPITVMAFDGEFYIDSIEHAEKIWEEQLARRPKVIAINCKNIKYIDSSAVGILVKFLNSAMKIKTELIFFDLGESIFNVFKTAKLSNFFKIMSRTQFEMEYLEKKTSK
jgi:anti-sigma B factor antagonist